MPDSARGQLSQSSHSVVPNESALRARVQRARRAIYPPLPQSLATLILAGAVLLTNAGDPFMFYDSGAGVNTFLGSIYIGFVYVGSASYVSIQYN